MDKETAEQCAAICDAEAATVHDSIRKTKSGNTEENKLRCRVATSLAWQIRRKAGLIEESAKPKWLAGTAEPKSPLRPPKYHTQIKKGY